jgi:6-phosphogluconolactonase (cycloisomerase 2 family)
MPRAAHRNTFIALLTLASALVAASTCGDGGVAKGSLFVVVTDTSGAPVPNATVTTMPSTEELTTDAIGTAFFTKIAVGGYAVTAMHPTAGAGRAAVQVVVDDVANVSITVTAVGGPGTGGGGRGGGVGSGGSGGLGGSAPGTGGRGGGAGNTGTAGAGRGGTGVVGTGGTAASGTAGRGGTGGSAGTGGTGAGATIVLAALSKDNNGVNLSWTTTPAKSFATYRIYRNSSVIDILQDGASVQYRDETAQLGISYTYRVGGLTASGQEIQSNTQTIVGGVYVDVGSQVEAMMVDPKRPYLYAIDKVNNSLHFINLTSNTVEKTIFVGSSPVDLDINLQGTTLYVANFGSTQIATVDLDTRAMTGSIFVDTTVGTWDGNPYRLACTAGDTLVFTSMDQWNDLKLVNALTGAALHNTGSIYTPDLAASPDGTRLYVAGSFDGVMRFDIVNDKLQQVDSSGQGGAAKVNVTRDGKYVFSSAQKLLANNLKSVAGTFAESIVVVNSDGSVAIGARSIYDGNTFAVKRATPLMTSIMAISPDDTTLYLYDTTSSRIYVYRLK